MKRQPLQEVFPLLCYCRNLMTILGLGACGVAGAVLNPIDVIKIRMQNNSSVSPWPEKNIYSSAIRIFREEHLKGFTRGLSATIMRELLYSTIRMGAYEPILHSLHNEKENRHPSAVIKFASALLSGAVGSAIANPTDLVKVQLQTSRPCQPAPYAGAISGFIYIFSNFGLAGLYKGSTPTIARAAVLTSAQIGSYDTIKNNICKQQFGINEGTKLHFLSSLLAGLVTTTASNPGYITIICVRLR